MLTEELAAVAPAGGTALVTDGWEAVMRGILRVRLTVIVETVIVGTATAAR
jgi:hypothetical protein